MSKIYFIISLLAIWGVALLGLACAGNSAAQTISFQVNPINELSVSGNPGTLTVQTSTAGSDPNEVSDSSTAYDLTTNATNKKIIGQINSDMPTYTNLKINMVAPSGASSQGDQILSTSPTNLVTGIGKKKAQDLSITYKFSAGVEAGIVNSTQRTVTLTVLEGN